MVRTFSAITLDLTAVFIANTAIFICYSQSQSLPAALVVDESASKELEENECANASTIHLDIVKKNAGCLYEGYAEESAKTFKEK